MQPGPEPAEKEGTEPLNSVKIFQFSISEYKRQYQWGKT